MVSFDFIFFPTFEFIISHNFFGLLKLFCTKFLSYLIFASKITLFKIFA